MGGGIPCYFCVLIYVFSIFLLFGIGQVIMVSFLTLLFRTKSQKDFSLQDLLHCYGIMLIVCGASYAASLNLILCFFLNLLVPFFLVFLLTDKFNPKAYFLYGMEFVFLQLRPIPAQAMPARFMCFFLCPLPFSQSFFVSAFQNHQEEKALWNCEKRNE